MNKPVTFEAIYTTHHALVLKQARWLVGLEDADDLAQQVWLRVFLRLSTFRGEAKPSTWLYLITRRLAFDRHRLAQRRPWGYGVPIEAVYERATSHPSPEQLVIRREQRRRLTARVRRLSRQDREVLRGVLRGEPRRETAARLGILEQALKSRLHRARRRLQPAAS